MPTTILTQANVTWTNIVHPNARDIDALAKRYPQIHPLNLKDFLTDLEYPKLDHKDSYLFVVTQIPFYSEEEHSYRPAEVDIFICHGNLVTSHHGELTHLNQIFDQLQSDETTRVDWMGRGASPLLYRLLDTLVNDCFPMVHDVGIQLREVEHNMFHNNVRRVLHHVAEARRNIIVLRSILNTQKDVILGLFSGNWPFIQESLDPYWEDIAEHLAHLGLMLDQYAEVISGLSDTIDTLASHRIDEVVSLLTFVTILTLPVTILSTIFSMNVKIPYEDHPLAFFGVILIGICVTAGLVWFLRSKKWL